MPTRDVAHVFFAPGAVRKAYGRETVTGSTLTVSRNRGIERVQPVELTSTGSGFQGMVFRKGADGSPSWCCASKAEIAK